MLATYKNVLFLGHNHLLNTGTDDPSLTGTQAIFKVSCHQYQWLAGDMGPGNRTCLEVASMVVVTGGWWLFCPVENIKWPNILLLVYSL